MRSFFTYVSEKFEDIRKKVNKISWGTILVIYLLIALVFMIFGFGGLIYLDFENGRLFILEKFAEVGVDILIVSFFSFVIKKSFNEFSKESENKKLGNR